MSVRLSVYSYTFIHIHTHSYTVALIVAGRRLSSINTLVIAARPITAVSWSTRPVTYSQLNTGLHTHLIASITSRDRYTTLWTEDCTITLLLDRALTDIIAYKRFCRSRVRVREAAVAAAGTPCTRIRAAGPYSVIVVSLTALHTVGVNDFLVVF